MIPGSQISYPGLEVYEAEKALEEESGALHSFYELFDKSNTALINEILEQANLYHLSLASLSVGKGKLTVSGTASDWDNCQKYRDHLSKCGYSLSLNRRESLADSKVYFTITGHFGNAE